MKRNTFWMVVVATLVGNVALTVTTTRHAKAQGPAPMVGDVVAGGSNTLASVNRTTLAARVQAPGASSASEESKSLKVPGGLAFSEFEGYENWGVVAVHHTDDLVKTILGNPVAIDAYRSGIPGNGKPFPDGAKLSKIEWRPAKSTTAPYDINVPGNNYATEIMVKDSKRFADGGGWGYAVFVPDGATGTYKPGGLDHVPPQRNDAKCGVACHTIVKGRDYVFTEYARRP
jgi:hypothetical protein